ncbi:hypothetical protein ELQ90_07745 [Labedella phragmitis]|uniref:Uncharacterized protein n=1 Tax=Labedella phragmitis TaxID=2498849 RepID=A0A444PVR8_9MICO|nr:hypothetical protein [Labedella phragmitis]RWZ51957.1 hypothetical protein ELQ90_07745 [Labedella phragmitis]
MVQPDGLTAAADELYTVPLDDFTSVRNARASAAKKSGERELGAAVAALRKPSAAAWASNLLFRSSDDVARDLDRLREDISAATTAGDRDALKKFAGLRHSLIGDLVDEARSLAEAAGRPLSAAAADELSEALSAALADRLVATAMSTGRLIRAPEPGGMSRGDLTAIVELPPDELTTADADDDGSDPDGSDDGSTASRQLRAARSTTTRTSQRSVARERRATPDGPSPAERRRHERDLRAAESRAEAARADRERRERERDALASRRDELAAEAARQRDVLRGLERRLDDADDAVDARTADIRARELDWKRAEAEARAARRVVDEDRSFAGDGQEDGDRGDGE